MPIIYITHLLASFMPGFDTAENREKISRYLELSV
jgi:hypothetical protein